jgi:hypothetical protein
MSYDLFFKPRIGTFKQERFFEYFRLREHYVQSSLQFWYKNEDTGVYFSFEFQEPDQAGLPVALNINYFRPSYFILEAEPEVTDFVRHFDLLVSDPQMHGMGEGDYQTDLLISGWNHGNEFAYSTLTDAVSQRDNISSFASAKLFRIWTWNRSRKKLQRQVGDSKFVPRIIFIRIDQQIFSAAVWPDGIPALIPPVDYLIVPRKKWLPNDSSGELRTVFCSPGQMCIPCSSATVHERTATQSLWITTDHQRKLPPLSRRYSTMAVNSTEYPQIRSWIANWLRNMFASWIRYAEVSP